MSEWKERALVRKASRQSKESEPINSKKCKPAKKKPWRVMYLLKEDSIGNMFNFATRGWMLFNKYNTEEDAKQGMAATKHKTYYKEYKFKLVYKK